MSKNTGATRFRKINVDEFDENNFQDDLGDEVTAGGPDEKKVNDFIFAYPFSVNKFYYFIYICNSTTILQVQNLN